MILEDKPPTVSHHRDYCLSLSDKKDYDSKMMICWDSVENEKDEEFKEENKGNTDASNKLESAVNENEPHLLTCLPYRESCMQ